MKKQLNKNSLKSGIPLDKNLPGLPAMFDAGMIQTLLTEHFKKIGASISSCEVSYIRYKPRTNCIIVYWIKFDDKLAFGVKELPVYIKLYTKEDFLTAEEKNRIHRWADFCGIGTYKLLTEHNAILYLFPNDPVIDGLRIIENPKKIQRILYQHYKKYSEKEWRISDRQFRFTIMRYKPERRAVIRFNSKAAKDAVGYKEKLSIFARIYADDSGQKVFDIHKSLYQFSLKDEHFDIPEPIVYLPDRRILLMERLKGKTLLDCIKKNKIETLSSTAEAIASVHRLKVDNLPMLPLTALIKSAEASYEMISEIAPDLSKSAELIHDTLLKSIENLSGPNAGFVHGDFYPGQVIIKGNRVGIIDFDRSYMGDPIADIGNFIAHIRLLKLKGNINNNDVIEQVFLSAYEESNGKKLDENRIRFWTVFGLYQLAVNPFRGLEPGWRARTGQILNECQKLLP